MKTSFKFLSACIIAAALVGCQGNRYNIDGRIGEEWADGTIFCIPAGQRNAAALDSATINADGTLQGEGKLRGMYSSGSGFWVDLSHGALSPVE